MTCMKQKAIILLDHLKDKILENIDMSLNSIRETSRYLVGLLVFLGLLGTFWGLLKQLVQLVMS